MNNAKVVKTKIGPDGIASIIYNDESIFVLDAKSINTKRASHVEPGPNGTWTADMTPIDNKTILGPFKTRTEALEKEVEWLNTNFF